MMRMFACLLGLVCFATAGEFAGAASPLKILVYGGSGQIGQRIVREALRRGDDVTVVVRDPSHVPPAAHLKVLRGDVLNTTHVARTIAGEDVVVCAVSFRHPVDPPAYRKAAVSLVTAMRRLGAHAPRLIFVGGAGSLHDASGALAVERIPPAYRPEVLGQKDALDYFRTVPDVPWTYFSPAFTISAGTRTGKFRLGDDQLVTDAHGDSRISMEDYAVAVLDEAEKPAHLHRRFTIGY